MKRILIMILILFLAAVPALADPLPLLEDYAGDIVVQYDETDPSAGVFSYSYRYPHPDEKAEGGPEINIFYTDLIGYDLGFTVPIIQEAFEGFDSSTVITYTVTCNNDDYFSVLVRIEEQNPDITRVSWNAHVFSRKNGSPGQTYTLPKVLGILSANENEEWLQNRQTEKADSLIREMVWDIISENPDNIDYGDLSEELLSGIFFPEEDFYLDENGDPVFYLQPCDVFEEVPEGMDLITIPIALEDILDEM